MATIDFTGTDGDPWPTDEFDAPSGGTTTIVSNRGRLLQTSAYGGVDVRADTSGVLHGPDFDRYFTVYPMAWGVTEMQVAWQFRRDTDPYREEVVLECSSIYGSITPGRVRLQKNEWGGITVHGELQIDISTDPTAIHFRVYADGADVKLKAWRDGQSEPGAWDIEAVSPDYAAVPGTLLSLYSSNNNDYVDFDNITDAAGGGATNHTQTLTGSTTPTGSLRDATAKNLIGATTPTGAPSERVILTRAGTSTPTGLEVQQIGKRVAGTTTPTGALREAVGKLLSGSTTPAGNAAKAAAHKLTGSTTPTGLVATIRAFLQTLTGSTTPTGANRQSVGQRTTGTTTPTGALVKAVSNRLIGTTTPTGALRKAISQLLAGAATTAGSIIRAIAKRLSGSSTPTGTVESVVTANGDGPEITGPLRTLLTAIARTTTLISPARTTDLTAIERTTTEVR